MSFEMPPDPSPSRGRPVVATRSRGRALLPTLVVLGVLLVAFLLFTGFYTEWLWFDSVEFTSVYSTQIVTRLVLFLVFGGLLALAVLANIVVAYRFRPPFRGLSPEQQSLDRYRVSIDPYRRAILVVIGIVLLLLGGGAASGEWRQYLLWRNGTDFGVEDAQFGTDVGFFAFDLPFYRFVLGFLFAAVIVSLLVSVATHYVYGGIRLQSPGERATPAARVHLSILLGIFVLLKAIAYWLDRYQLAVKEGDRITGLTYTDVNALLPAKAILTGIALLCALLFFANVFRRTWSLPILGFGLLVLSAVLLGGVYPAIVQYFQVRPSEPQREAPYIERNIDATRDAYGLSDVEVTPYAAASETTPEQLEASSGTINNVRLLDPAVVPPTFNQLQQIRGFYSFPDSLDVDRYQLEGERDAVVAVREVNLDGLNANQRNWANDHTVYTHGYGLVAAYGNSQLPNGRPDFFSFDIPEQGVLADQIDQPRVYFGEESPEYSIVGAPDDAEPRELDFPDDTQPNGQANNTYDGEGGVGVGSFVRKLLFATKFQEGNIILSDLVNEESKILWDRQPRERIEKVAPWLTLDGDPYPAAVDGRIVWIVDGYTTSNGYPYSERTTLGEATADALTATTAAVAAQRADRVNYIRNSVKATVDAYDGTVTLYEWDTEDPVLKTWMKAFPDTVTPRDDIPESLLAHLRYPEDLFKVQRELFARYHVTDPGAFYTGSEFWVIPDDPTSRGAGDEAQPPYYLSVQMPGTDAPAFSLTTTFAPRERETLAAFMSVNAEPGEDYGTIRVLQLPSSTTIPGPGQAQNNFSSDPDVATEINLLQRGGSTVEFGNLLSLPAGGGILYVEPVYVRAASGEASFPLLRRVLVSFGERVGFAPDLQGALEQVFQDEPGEDGEGETPEPEPSPSPTDPSPSPTEPSPSPTTPPDPGAGTPEERLTQALSDANTAIADANAALARGDFAAYGEAQDRLTDAIARATAAQEELGGGGASPAAAAFLRPD